MARVGSPPPSQAVVRERPIALGEVALQVEEGLLHKTVGQVSDQEDGRGRDDREDPEHTRAVGPGPDQLVDRDVIDVEPIRNRPDVDELAIAEKATPHPVGPASAYRMRPTERNARAV